MSTLVGLFLLAEGTIKFEGFVSDWPHAAIVMAAIMGGSIVVSAAIISFIWFLKK